MGVAVLFVSMLMVVRHTSSILPKDSRLSGNLFTRIPRGSFLRKECALEHLSSKVGVEAIVEGVGMIG